MSERGENERESRDIQGEWVLTNSKGIAQDVSHEDSRANWELKDGPEETAAGRTSHLGVKQGDGDSGDPKANPEEDPEEDKEPEREGETWKREIIFPMMLMRSDLIRF